MNRNLVKTAALLVFSAPIGASAAPLFEGGLLTGATGVEVNGALYDVSFAAGTCIELFSGCDQSSDFFFRNTTDAVAAAQALLDQVLLDGVLPVDSQPALVSGCADPGGCYIFTPYSSHPAGPGFSHVGMTFNGPSTDYAVASAAANNNGPYTAWALWSASQPIGASEPGTLLLLVAGILGLGGRRGRRGIPGRS